MPTIDDDDKENRKESEVEQVSDHLNERIVVENPKKSIEHKAYTFLRAQLVSEKERKQNVNNNDEVR